MSKNNTAKSNIPSKLNPLVANDTVKPLKKPPKYPADDQGCHYWLIKLEPVSRIDKTTNQDVKFSLRDLSDVEKEPWDGVRNYEARNNLITMAVNDLCLFYHSNCQVPGIVGEAKVVQSAYPDKTQFDATHRYYDAKSTAAKPKWWCPEVSFQRRFRRKVTLEELKQSKHEALQDFMLLTRGRLSVIPVSLEQYNQIIEMESAGQASNDIDCDIPQK